MGQARNKNAEIFAMLNRLPKHLPDFNDLVYQLGQPSDNDLARSLGVTVTTIRRWKKQGADKPVLFSLWFLTHDGRRQIETDLVNEVRNQAGLARALKRENDALRQVVMKLYAIGQFGAANEPSFVLMARGTRETAHELSTRHTAPHAQTAGLQSQTLTTSDPRYAR